MYPRANSMVSNQPHQCLNSSINYTVSISTPAGYLNCLLPRLLNYPFHIWLAPLAAHLSCYSEVLLSPQCRSVTNSPRPALVEAVRGLNHCGAQSVETPAKKLLTLANIGNNEQRDIYHVLAVHQSLRREEHEKPFWQSDESEKQLHDEL